jgi:2-keto-3-deoxy-L-rhamnonate aldolase RhmA
MFEIVDMKKELMSGKKKTGAFIWSLTDQFVPLIVKNAGFEIIDIDMEHCSYDFGTAHALVQACRSCGLFPLVRVPEPSKNFIQKALDMGARGIVLPLVETAEQAKELARLAKYPPDGQRGMGPGIGHMDYGMPGDLGRYMKESNERTILLVQPETPKGVKNLKSILALPWIDGIQTGPFDLSVSHGVPGRFDSEVFKNANAKTIKIARSMNKLVFGFAGNDAQAEILVALDVNVLFMNTDVGLLSRAYREEFAALEGFLGGKKK